MTGDRPPRSLAQAGLEFGCGLALGLFLIPGVLLVLALALAAILGWL